ncbi:hypothetical protein P3S67_006505 [Capsicum chacoense]
MLPTNYVCHSHSSNSCVDVTPISKQEGSINIPPIIAGSYTSYVPLFKIYFDFCIQDQFWYRQPNDPELVLTHRTWENSTKFSHIIHLTDIKLYQRLDPAIATILLHLKDACGDQFYAIIERTTDQLQRLITSRDMSGACVNVALEINHICDGEILLASEELSMDGMIPASKSSIGMLEPMEPHEINMKDECMVCLEEIQEETIVLSLPCSHMFHGECVTKWLENSHYCPLCRFEMPMD